MKCIHTHTHTHTHTHIRVYGFIVLVINQLNAQILVL